MMRKRLPDCSRYFLPQISVISADKNSVLYLLFSKVVAYK